MKKSLALAIGILAITAAHASEVGIAYEHGRGTGATRPEYNQVTTTFAAPFTKDIAFGAKLTANRAATNAYTVEGTGSYNFGPAYAKASIGTEFDAGNTSFYSIGAGTRYPVGPVTLNADIERRNAFGSGASFTKTSLGVGTSFKTVNVSAAYVRRLGDVSNRGFEVAISKQF